MTVQTISWERTTMGSIGRYLNGRAFKSSEWAPNGRPIIRIQNLTGSGTDFNYFQGEIEDRYLVKPGDLLFSWSATLGTYVWKGPEAVLNQHIFKVESHINPSFHRHLLDFKIQEMQSQTHGSGIVHITKKSFDSIPVDLPSTEEQHQIVEILEDHLSRLDAALADIKQAKIKTAQLRTSLINQCSAGWIDDVNLQNKYDATGRPQLAQGWKWRTIDEIIGGVRQNAAIGPFGSNLKVSDYREKGAPLVFVRNIRTKVFAPIGQPCIDVEKATSLAVHDVKFGDVLVTKMGDPPGDSAVYSLRTPGIITSDCLRLRPSGDFNANYIAMAISSSFVQQQIGRISQGVAQQKMSLDRFRKYVEIPCPDLATQMRILKHQDQILESLRVGFSDANSLEGYAANLRRSLLQAAFTGQLTREITHA